MISAAYVQQMARYNTWQNAQIAGFIAPMDHAALVQDRGAFCKSILGTLNHILWGDMMWMSRFSEAVEAPAAVSSMAETTEICASGAAWTARRQEMDAAITTWAAEVTDAALAGDLSWYAVMLQATMRKPMADCVVHLFNHQTHHRGQVHAMLTAAGSDAPVSDIILMPED